MILSVCWFSLAAKTKAQEVEFLSPAVEEGVRAHLGMDNGGTVGFEQLDTITTLDLSRRGVTDIHDLLLMPNLREVDLSKNMLENLYPLTVLDSLERVDLSYNNLKDISDLYFSSSKKMTVDVAFNYIRNFSVFGLKTRCDFTLEGTGLQFPENPQTFDVHQLFCDASVSPAMVYVNVSTNMAEIPQIVCGKSQFEVPLDSFYVHALSEDIDVKAPVFLTNGTKTDSTVVIPIKTVQLNKLEEVVIETGIPEIFDISIPLCSQGTLVKEGQNLRYSASSTFKYEEIIYNYRLCGTLRGIAKIVLTSGEVPDKPCDVNEDGYVNISDVVAVINQMAGTQTYRYADVNNDGAVNISDVVAIINAMAAGQ